jgi:hypothetical protein
MENAFKIPVSAFIVLEGKTKEGKEYSFVKMEKQWANNSKFIADLKASGVQVNGNGGGAELPYEKA